MSTNELKAIEVLLTCLTTKNAEQVNYLAYDEDSFNNSKLSLFNRITINTLLKSYQDTLLFPKEKFLSTGVIPGTYDTKVEVPVYQGNVDAFYEKLITSLRNNDYYFDKEGNICIPELQTTIFPIWLHRLAETMRDLSYKNIYLYNKNKDAKIYDEESLIAYLNQSKTFFVTMDNLPISDMDEVFTKIKRKTDNTVSQKGQVKVDEIMDIFLKYTPEEFNAKAHKFIIPSPIYIVKKANDMGSEFYSAPTRVQQELITKWLTEYMLSNDIAASNLQKALLVKEPKKLSTMPHNEKQSTICGLHNVLFTVLDYDRVDYDTISLSDFQIDTYLSSTHQDTQVTLNEIINMIESNENSTLLASTKDQIATLMDEINRLDSTEHSKELTAKQQKINGLFNRYKKMELDRETLIEKRNSLQNILHYHKTHDKDELNFDNPKIAALIKKATINGQVMINPLDNRKISIKIINPETGKTTFEANILIKDLLKFTQDINIQFDEAEILMAA